MLVVLVIAAVLAVTPRAHSASATCSAPGGPTYRVTWNVEKSELGAIARISGLHRQQGSSWIDEGSSTWQLRWEHTAAELDTIVGAFREKTGTLAALVEVPVAAYLSPNVVVPDGSCVVYMYPFAQGTGPKVAVLGDSLTESLRDPVYNQTWVQGFVQGNLAAAGRRAEVEGQGGRRWSPHEGSIGLARADGYLLDELRGLRNTSGGLEAIVIALGSNDAGWVALGPTASERQRRLDYVIQQLGEVLSEVGTYGTCTVVVTTVDNLASYWGSLPGTYTWAAQTINNWLRSAAAKSRTDWLRLEDWAQQSAGHHRWGAESWFAEDDLHLNTLGRQKYAAALSRAAAACQNGGRVPQKSAFTPT